MLSGTLINNNYNKSSITYNKIVIKSLIYQHFFDLLKNEKSKRL